MVTNSYFRNKNYCISLKGIISYKYYNGCLDVIADSYNAIKSSFSNFAVTPLVAYYGGVVLHASGVMLKRKEKAVLFMGVCGAGKLSIMLLAVAVYALLLPLLLHFEHYAREKRNESYLGEAQRRRRSSVIFGFLKERENIFDIMRQKVGAASRNAFMTI